jgi:hypothetical protein
MALFPLGILSAAGGVGATYELISSTILGTAQSSVVFDVSSYASTYKHLQLRVVARNTGENGNVLMRMNADTGSNYSRHALYGDGSSVLSNAGASQTAIEIGSTTLNSNTANAFGAGVYDLLDPFSSTKNKTVRSLTGQVPNNQILLRSGAYFSTTATSSITLLTAANNFAVGSRFSLYGIRG